MLDRRAGASSGGVVSRSLWTFALIIAGVMLQTSATAWAQQSKVGWDRVRIGLCQNVAPCGNQSGKPDGILVDLWRAWGERNRVEVEFDILADDALAHDALNRGNIDLIGGLETQQIQSDLLFSRAIACFNRVAVHRGNVRRRDLVGLQEHQLEFDSRLAGDMPHLERWIPEGRARLAAEPSSDSGAVWITSEVFQSGVHGLSFASQCEDSFVVYKRLIFFCASADQQELMDFVEAGWDSVDKSKLLSIENTWLPAGRNRVFDKNSRLEFSREELSVLARHPVLLLGASRWEPLTVVDENENYSGIALDLATLHLGLLGITPVYEGSEDWNEVKTRFESGELDGLGYMMPSPERHEQYGVSDPYVYAPLVVVARQGETLEDRPEDLRGKSFGIIDDYGFGVTFKRDRPGITMRSFPDRRLAALALRDKEIDGWLEIAPTARKIAADLGIDDFQIAFPTKLVDGMSLVLKPELKIPRRLFNRALRTTSSEQVATIYSRYEPEFIEDNWRSTLGVIVGLSVLLVLSSVTAVRSAAAVRRSRREIELSEQTLRLAQRVSGSGSLEFDIGAQQVRMIGETYRVFGGESARVEETVDDHVARFDKASAIQLLSAFQARSAGMQTSHSLQLKLNSESVLQYEFSRSEPADGASCLISIQDVTERVRKDRERLDLNEKIGQLKKLEALGSLAGGIAHDFNNILSASIAYNELALEEIDSKHSAREHMDQVLNASLRAKDLVAQILTFSSGRGVAEATVDLNRVAEESLMAIRSATPDGITIEFNRQPDPVLITANSIKLMQVFINLLSNAIQAMPEGGRVFLHVSQRQGIALVQVGDEGIGIPAELQDKVFDPFFTTRKVGEGTGMGLAIVHSIVRGMSGQIEFESSSEGTVFSVELPVAAVAAPVVDETVPRSASAEAAREIKGVRIMAVDDERMVLDAEVQLLTLLGYDVAGFTSADEALTCFRDHPEEFDLLITDLAMPDVSGMELVQSVRKLREGFPAVVCSGYDVEDELAAYPHLRRSLTRLNKPFTSQTLASAVQRGLSPAGS